MSDHAAAAPAPAQLLRQLPIVVYRAAPALLGQTHYISAACQDLVGRPPAAFTTGAVSLGSLIWADDRPEVAAELAAAQREGRAYRCHYRLTDLNGEPCWVVDLGHFTAGEPGAWREGVLAPFPEPTRADRVRVQAERNRLARELHDSVTQSLYSVTLFAQAGRQLAESGAADRASGYFDDVLDTSQQALRELRLLVHQLRPSILAEAGLVRALQQRLNAVEGRTGVQHSLWASPSLTLDPEQEEVLYHVAQEALNNALKHASARSVGVSLTQAAGETELTITDDGCGFDPAVAADGGGLGLVSMQERVADAGGTLRIASPEAGGTVVAVALPNPARSRDDG